MEWISKYYGGSTTVGKILMEYAQQQQQQFTLLEIMAVIDLNGVPSTNLNNLVDHYFNHTTTNNLFQSIDNGHPVIGAILNPGSTTDWHAIMITGYNNDGTMEYFDPQTGVYGTELSGKIYNVIEITGKK